jgi:[CysO sulfur-carrier protein]-thiocarboxylate-dependent cysteine synthase
MRSLTRTEFSEGRGEAPRALGPRKRRYAGIVESIGDTPTIEIPRLAPSPDVRLFAKLEAANPTGSIKDRVARALIEDLEARGRLKPGSIILEATSGNTGIALAMIGRRKGYRVAVVMPDNVTLERRQLVALHGAEVIDSPGAAGSNGAIALARELVARDPQFVMADQYANPANPRVHEETTGPEILDAVPELDVFVAGLGTGGTLTGVGRFLRRAKPGVRIVAAEPLPGEAVQGLRSLDDGFVPEIFDPTLLDDRYVVANRDAVETARELLEREGVLAGPSSGAVLWVAARVAETMERGTIVALLPDGGWKYLSTGTYSRPLDEMEDELEGGVAWW